MAAGYVEEESQVWKCPKHPSKRNRSNGVGICPSCLRERLAGLCPECANMRPCSCALSSSSSSSSGGGESSLRRSRSVAVPIKTPSFLSILKRNKTTKRKGVVTEAKKEEEEEEESIINSNNRIEDFARLITRSRSVTVSVNTSKPKSWHPMKVFKTSWLPKFVIHERSPLHRA